MKPSMKVYICSALSLLLSFSAAAAQPRFTFGVQWGYSPSVFESHTIAYRNIEEPHYVIPDSGYGWGWYSNAYVTAHAGILFAKHSKLSLESGYEGLHRDIRVIPLFLAYEYAFNGHYTDGAVCEAAAGPCWEVHGNAVPLLDARLAGGYRFVLGDKMNLEFKLSVRCCAGSVKVVDKVTGTVVPKDNIIRNNSVFCSVGIGTALNF